MTTKQDWMGRTGGTWAGEWQRTDRSFGGLTDRLLATIHQNSFSRALDVGCGAGEIALALARGHSGASIVGIDVSEDLLKAARSRSANLNNVMFQRSDAAEWDPGDFRADLIVSRHGLMFFEEPASAMAHLAKMAEPEARLVFSCFRNRGDNPWAEQISKLLPPGAAPQSDPIAPGPFAFANPEYTGKILEDAGWHDATFAEVDYAYIAGAGDNPVEDAVDFFQRIGPAASICANLPATDRDRFLDRLRQYLSHHEADGIVALRASAWIVAANNAA